jgi:hypothetical protein
MGARPATKYGNRRVTEDGIPFDSLAELRRYRELRMLEAAGVIAGLEVHPRYPLVVNGVKVGSYEADFRYVTPEGETVIEDVKGVRTSTYKLKKRLVEALYGIQVVEVEA